MPNLSLLNPLDLAVEGLALTQAMTEGREDSGDLVHQLSEDSTRVTGPQALSDPFNWTRPSESRPPGRLSQLNVRTGMGGHQRWSQLIIKPVLEQR